MLQFGQHKILIKCALHLFDATAVQYNGSIFAHTVTQIINIGIYEQFALQSYLSPKFIFEFRIDMTIPI